MVNLLRRYGHTLRKYKRGYALTFVAIALVVSIGLMVFSSVNANFNQSLHLDDPEVNPQDYTFFSRMFFAGYALYADTNGPDDKPLIEGYRHQTQEQGLPMHKMMSVCVSEKRIRSEFLKLSGIEGYKQSDFEMQVSYFGSMCYRIYVYSRHLELTKAIGNAVNDHLAEIFERELGITYIRLTGDANVRTDQPRPPHYLDRVKDSRSQAIADEEMNKRPEALKRPVFRKLVCVVAGVGTAFLVILIFLILSEYFSNAMYTPEHIQEVTARPFLANIPNKASAKACKVLAKTIIQSDEFGKTILITGCRPENRIGHGAVDVAKALAGEGKKVLLLTLSPEKNGPDDVLKLEKSHGISDIHAGEINIQHPTENLDAVPVGSDPAKLEEACESEAFAEFMAKMRETYDYILCYDTNVTQSPPMFSVMKYADAALLAVEYNRITKSQLRITLERLSLMKVDNQFVIMLDTVS